MQDRERRHRDRVGRRCRHGGEDEGAEDDPRAVLADGLAGNDPGQVEHHHEQRDLHGDAEDQQHAGEEGEVLAELDQVGQVARRQADQDLEPLGQDVVAQGHATDEQRTGHGREDLAPLPLAAVQAGQEEAPDLVEPVGAACDEGGHTAQLELEHQGAGGALDVGLGVDLVAECLLGVVVGRQDEVEQDVVEEECDEEGHDHDQRRPDQPCPKLTEVVGERHPAVGAHGVLRPADEELKNSGDAHERSIGRSAGGAVAVLVTDALSGLGLTLLDLELLGRLEAVVIARDPWSRP